MSTHTLVLNHMFMQLITQTTTIPSRFDMCDPTRDDGSSQSGVVRKEKKSIFSEKMDVDRCSENV